VNGIGAYYYATAEPGLFVVSASFLPDEANGGPEAVVAAVLREVALLRTDPPSRRELERVRTVLENQAIYQTRTVEGIANRIGYFHTVAGGLDFERTFIERIRQVTPEQLAEVAGRWLTPENLTVGLMLPTAWTDRAPDHAALSTVVATTWAETAESAGAAVVADEYGVVRHVFDNGLVLLIEQDATSPTFTARTAALSGALYEPESEAGITHFAAELLTSGTTRHTASELSRAVDSLAAGLSGFSGRNSMGAQVTALSGDLDDGLELLAEIVFDATFPADELERVRRETLEAIEASNDDLAGTAYRMFGAEVFGSHPYARPMIGTEESVRSITRSEVVAWHRATMRPERMVVAVVGDVDPVEVINTVGALFSREVDGEPVTAQPTTTLPAPHTIRVEQSRERQQAHIVVGYPGVAEDDPSRASLDVLAAILSGQGGRLFYELRDRQGLAYSVSASNSAAVGAGTFSFYIATSEANLEPAIGAMQEQIERLRTEGVTADEVARAQRLILGRRDISLQRQNARAGHLCVDTLLGRGHGYRWQWPSELEAVTADSVGAAIARIFVESHEVVSVVRPGVGTQPAE
jgi:zinc protease